MITKEAAFQKISELVEQFNEQFDADDLGIGDVGCEPTITKHPISTNSPTGAKVKRQKIHIGR